MTRLTLNEKEKKVKRIHGWSVCEGCVKRIGADLIITLIRVFYTLFSTSLALCRSSRTLTVSYQDRV